MRSRIYLGDSFEVWNRQQTWFWSIARSNPNNGRGAVGAAASEDDAISEACATIEEMLAERGAEAARAIDPVISALEVIAWEHSLTSLERYLDRACLDNA
jgi:hypothetical protein